MLCSSGHTDGHWHSSYELGGDKAGPTAVTHHFCCSWGVIWHSKLVFAEWNLSTSFFKLLEVIPVQRVLFSVLGLGFFQPAQHQETHTVLFSPCFFLDPLHDNEQWWTWSPQSHYLNWNGGVSHPQVLLTDSGFQRGLLFLEKQAPFFREGKRGFVPEVSFWREETHPEPDTAEVSASVPPQWEKWLPKSVYFGFVVVSAPRFIISSNVRSRKSIVLLQLLTQLLLCYYLMWLSLAQQSVT